MTESAILAKNNNKLFVSDWVKKAFWRDADYIIFRFIYILSVQDDVCTI